jgi:hypothetical protein
MRILTLSSIIAILLLIFPLEATSQDVTQLMNKYERCERPDICKKLEMTLIKSFLNKAKILDVLEKMPEENDIKREIIIANLTGIDSKDYIFKIVIDRLGYIVVVKRDLKNKKFITLPIIQKGYIYMI